MYLDLGCKQLCFPPRKGINRRNERTMIIRKNCDLWVLFFLFKVTFWLFQPWRLFPSDSEEFILLIQEKDKFSLHDWQDFPWRSMSTFRNKRKLTAVSGETSEDSRSSRGQNVLDLELTQDYISQVSEEIEGRVTKKLPEEFSKTESRILGALSKLDEFLLNSQVRTCSVAVQGTSRNANLENRETHRDRSSDDPYDEVGHFAHHSGQPNSPMTETNSHMVTENYPHKYWRWQCYHVQPQMQSPIIINKSYKKRRLFRNHGLNWKLI